MSANNEVKVVGGGIAGIVSAIYAARQGARVELFESVSQLGGRARTRDEAGFRFNMGPHALYKSSSAGDVLRDLEIEVEGSSPPLSGSLARYEGRLSALPGGLVSLLTTGLLKLPEKLELGGFLARLPRVDTSQWDDRSLTDVLREEIKHERVRALGRALVRLSTYANAPDRMSGGAALHQVQLALGGVLYLDRGWQQLVERLKRLALAEGVTLRTGARIRAVEFDAEGAAALRSADDTRVPARRIVLALGPNEASALVDSGSDARFQEWAECSVPARAACLDLGLRGLPIPRNRFALGIDEALYFSVHSGIADALAPDGGALIQVARYLAPDEKPERAELQAQLEGLVDQLQPGWRERVETSKLLTDLRVSHAVPIAASGGLHGRPGVQVAHRPGLFIAGDWVGPEGQLADASFASGRAAGRRVAGVRGSAVAA